MCAQVLVPLIAYVGAPASGAHFNPIITFSFMMTGIMVMTHCDVACASITNMPESLMNGACMWLGMQVMVGHLMKPEKMNMVSHLLYQLVTTLD